LDDGKAMELYKLRFGGVANGFVGEGTGAAAEHLFGRT
jgi:hypothetical protein